MQRSKVNIKGFGIGCGHALNRTGSTLRIASIVNGGGTTCTVRDTQGKVLSRSWRCEVRSVGSGRMSPFLGAGQDVDAITFDRSFQVNEHEFKSGEWVKIKRVAVCVNLEKTVTVPFTKIRRKIIDTQPRCYTT